MDFVWIDQKAVRSRIFQRTVAADGAELKHVQCQGRKRKKKIELRLAMREREREEKKLEKVESNLWVIKQVNNSIKFS